MSRSLRFEPWISLRQMNRNRVDACLHRRRSDSMLRFQPQSARARGVHPFTCAARRRSLMSQTIALAHHSKNPRALCPGAA